MSRLLSKFARAAVVGVLALASAAPPAMAQDARRVTMDLGANSGMSITIAKGQAASIELPYKINEIVPADEAVVSVAPITNSHFTVIGKAVGRTNVLIYNNVGQRVGSLDVKVEPNTADALGAIRTLVPGFRGQVVAIGQGFALMGTAATPDEAKAAEDVLKAFAGANTPVINRMTVATPQMVMMSAKVVEVSRSAIKQFGLDAATVLGSVGGPQYSLLNSATFGVNGSFLGAMTGGYSLNTTTQPIAAGPGQCSNSTVVDGSNAGNCVGVDRVGSSGLNRAQSMIRAFERSGLFRTIAEPSLVTASGKMAKLNAGGEFPVPTGQDNTGKITIEFKEYGVGLQVTPTITSAGEIELVLMTEMSDLSSLGAFTLSNGAGSTTTTVPSLVGNKSEATVVLPSGGSVMVSSLLKQTSKETIDSVPGLGGPAAGPLGLLLRSRDYQQGDTELAVIVTATLVRSVDGSQLQTPADNLQIASDLETILLGRLNRPLKRPAGALPRAYQGPVGYVIE